MKTTYLKLIFLAFLTLCAISCSDDDDEQVEMEAVDGVADPSLIFDAAGNVIPENLIASLRNGGYVIYFRHATATNGVDQHTDLNDCATQRNLTLPQGRTESELIGESFRRLQIPVGQSVLTSMYCRCRQTAEFAFGPEVTNPILELSGYPFRYDYRIAENEIARRIAAVNRILETVPAQGSNQIIVGHANNFAGGDNPYSGAVILLPQGEGRGYRVITRVDNYMTWVEWADRY